ncbi:hypothetical protein HBI56_067100 [Parastagonospora nodorum]|uniref:Uncharacterized protein n=1 Tax=Phaeosphaeria nodorum (strain SN15 / ATCC MYA-4574 / FGSC 10173) TaxID=321614 RepID=A0A7U2ENN7_PHANO|nr:hypothetical protein HBH56_001600 [Parastagonospora nodorum]QRC90137.1 hypothetical protein JI435_400210 [Parastagonospora nodorum SN15]KAH3937594.1 hypothetical protein HBH54_001610 [Parastagonospora nodorum]KAH3940866.1 hypothetical protein HBH53_210910 [Parastagonospora nodorum]KAH3958509.1 hypothetical protein HBH51_209440 [Parastagonospora nodorum]
MLEWDPRKRFRYRKRMRTPHQRQTTPVRSFRALPAAKYRALRYSRAGARDLAHWVRVTFGR